MEWRFRYRHKPVPGVHGPKDDLIDGFLIDDVPLDSLWTLEYLFDNCGVAGVGDFFFEVGLVVLQMKIYYGRFKDRKQLPFLTEKQD